MMCPRLSGVRTQTLGSSLEPQYGLYVVIMVSTFGEDEHATFEEEEHAHKEPGEIHHNGNATSILCLPV